MKLCSSDVEVVAPPLRKMDSRCTLEDSKGLSITLGWC